MVHSVEERGDVHVHHPLPPFPCLPLCGFDRPMRAASGTEPVAGFAKVWLEQRLHHLQQQLLHEAIQHIGDAQWPDAAIGFGDLFTPRGSGLVAAFEQLRLDPDSVFGEVPPQFIRPHAVGAGGSRVALHGAQRYLPVARLDDCFHSCLLHRWLVPWVSHDLRSAALLPA